MTTATSNWLALIFTVCIFSLVLYKDNKMFRIAENTLVGITAANAIVLNYHNYVRPTVLTDMGKNGKYWYIIPIVIGLLMYTRFIHQVRWLSRIPMALWLGIGTGYILTTTQGVFVTQIQATFKSLNTVNNILFVLGVVTVLAYFFFTVPTNNAPMRAMTGVGKVFLLVGFGAAFANTVMTRVSVLLGRMQFIIQDILRVGK